MKNFLYTVSVILMIAWAICYFVYALGTSAHLLLFLALLIGLVGILKKE